jgi:hypothetical protein
MKRLILAALMVALIAMPASAAVQSVKVSGSLDSTWVVRDQFDLGVVATATGDGEFYQNLFITQATVRFDADLTDNVSVVTQLINERAWDEEDSANTDIDINLAYLEMREFLNSALTIWVGRFPLAYGNQFVVGQGPNNIVPSGAGGLSGVAEDLTWRTEFDGVRMVFDYDPLVIDMFAVKADANQLTGSSQQTSSIDDVDLYGIQSTWSLGDEYNTGIESYMFVRLNEDLQENSTANGAKTDEVFVPGLRVFSNPIEGLYTSAEFAMQWGNKSFTGETVSTPDNLRRDAKAAQVIASYAIPGETVADYSPVVSGSYTWVSGDSNPDNERQFNEPGNPKEVWTAWDPMFENQAGGTIYNTLFDLTNAHIYNAALQITPMEDVIAKVSWWGMWLDQEIDNGSNFDRTSDFIMRQPDGTTVTPTVAVDKTLIGQEVDFDFLYNYTEDVQFGLSMGWFWPGPVFGVENDAIAKQFITKVGVDW